MSVRTTASEKIDSAKEHVKLAIKYLVAVVVEDCPGYEQFDDEYEQALCSALRMLVTVNDKLK